MSKGLEALKELKENVCYFAIGDYAYPRLDLIEKELKALEIIKKLFIIDNDKQRIDVKNCVEMNDDEYDLLIEVIE